MLRGVVFSWLVPSALSHVSIAAGGHVTCVLSRGRLRLGTIQAEVFYNVPQNPKP